MPTSQKSILFIQPSVNPPGGGNGVAAWMLQTLCAQHDVTLYTLEPFDVKLVDAYYGTNLAQSSLTTLCCHWPITKILGYLPVTTHLLSRHLVIRSARPLLQAPWDLICSAFDEQDFGQPSLDYVHHPWNLYPRPDAPKFLQGKWYFPWILKAYNWFCRQVSGFRTHNRPPNISLVNSAWCGGKLQQAYPGTPFQVVFPPAMAPMLNDDRARRQARFLSFGRLDPIKEWEKLVDIVWGLRALGHDVSLTLAGSRNQVYYEKIIRDKIEQAGDWVRLVMDFTDDERQELLLTHRYGIHGMTEEHYGMAVAELVLGGCLTMVPNGGGQVEIVTDPRLHYDNVDDAVAKWDRILNDPKLEKELLETQLAGRARLTKERFIKEFQQIVDLCLERGVVGAREFLALEANEAEPQLVQKL